MEKYLVTIEFRYMDVINEETAFKTKMVTCGIFGDAEEAYNCGNKSLELLESKFELNPNYNKKERFNSRNHLISNLAYLKTPFDFYAKITPLKFDFITDVVNEAIGAAERYNEYKKPEL